ncbi:NAD(P)-dependent oxidoreductase [Aureimonas sp. OT7]|uniref:NAD(P)-dependent oxidoreductase n=1 Tax=Aureimonas sp. OT7 TaxID=2816454 RepID=UPI00177B7580|nr:NAD(P)-dependent oxidoreductase [Aureimonas sp. OT7]QOG07231.1 NAD(P)-dependent oxidoreductase [Aureimonas sp. OT7]
MTQDAILLMGGSGAIGLLTAQALRAARPEVPLLIGGRDGAKAQATADRLGNAEGVAIDAHAQDLGLGDRRVSAVAVFYSDARLLGLNYAKARGLPHLGISSGIYEVAPEVAVHMNNPGASAIVLGYEWLVGATTVATLTSAKPFARLDSISIGALVDEDDGGGPAVAEDFERLSRMMPAALALRDGAYVWQSGDDARSRLHAIDGTPVEAKGFSSIDIVGLAAATGARNVRFDLATGVTSSRRRGEAKSTEIIIELEGEDRQGMPLRKRHAGFHPGGAAPLTALGTSMILERLVGLDGMAPTAPGLYFPYQILDHERYVRRLEDAGGRILELEPLA